MDFEKRVEVQREETAGALQILLGYAGKLAERDLKKNRESIEQLKKFSMNMACFFCVEGHEASCDEKIMEKYVQPYEHMMEGDKDALSGVQHDNISMDNIALFLSAIDRYKQEMLDDYNPVYDEDLELCESIMKAVTQQCIYENEINQRAMAGRKVAQMQEPEQAAENAADMGDMKEEQNGTIMQGM